MKSFKRHISEVYKDSGLGKWFGAGGKGGVGKGGWDRYNTKGERVGKCGDGKPGEGKPKCLSATKARKLRAQGGKNAIANAVKRKKAADPQVDRPGTGNKPINVSNKIKEDSNPRIPRKPGQPAKSKKHSDLYTDENPVGTIKGLGFKNVDTAEASVSKIKKSDRTHAHKVQAAVAMEQRAREMGKSSEAAVFRSYINSMKKITKAKNESVISECWSTHVQKGYKMKGGKRVPNCVPRNEGNQMRSFLNFIKDDCDCGIEEKSAAWQRKEGKNKEGGLNAKGRASYERENPGSDLKAPVSAAQAKKSKGGKAAKRRKSFCARMGGMPGPMKDEKGRPTRKALALRKWDC
tara:strand:- start:747 stop:1793 length:1047 start_codon:yes stop_codon:yes gene_type:complete